jgi:hypothetical protein
MFHTVPDIVLQNLSVMEQLKFHARDPLIISNEMLLI